MPPSVTKVQDTNDDTRTITMLEINFTLVLFAASFLVFIYLLNLTLYKPVGKIIEERKNLISSEHDKAKELRSKAKKILEDYTKEIKFARQNGQSIIQDTIDQATLKKEEKTYLLMDTLSKEKEEALKQIKIEQEKIMKALENQLKTLTDLITTKVLGMEKTLAGTY